MASLTDNTSVNDTGFLRVGNSETTGPGYIRYNNNQLQYYRSAIAGFGWENFNNDQIIGTTRRARITRVGAVTSFGTFSFVIYPISDSFTTVPTSAPATNRTLIPLNVIDRSEIRIVRIEFSFESFASSGNFTVSYRETVNGSNLPAIPFFNGDTTPLPIPGKVYQKTFFPKNANSIVLSTNSFAVLSLNSGTTRTIRDATCNVDYIIQPSGYTWL